MKRLQVESFGTEVQGVRLCGNPRNPEPETFRVRFSGGDVDVVRVAGGDYWIHVRVDTEQDVREERAEVVGHLADARLDIRGKDVGETDEGDFSHPGLYHLAVRIQS